MNYSLHLSFLLVFFFFGGRWFLTTTAANRCPEKEDMRPYCTCEYETLPRVTCDLVGNVEVLRKVFSATGDHPFPWIELTRCFMSYFPASALKEKAVRELFLEGVNLVGLFDRVPEPNHRLSVIDIHGSNILRGMEWPLLRNLNNLTGLYIDSVTIRSLGKEFMDNVPSSITGFVLQNNKLSRLNDRALSRFTELKTFGLSTQRITTLKRTMFPAENVIEILTIRDCPISELPDNLFSNMPKLQGVAFEKTLLTTISETIFNGISRNVHVLLLGNNIKCDCKVRWVMKTEWKKLEAKCHSPNHFKDKALIGGISDEDLDYCDDL